MGTRLQTTRPNRPLSRFAILQNQKRNIILLYSDNSDEIGAALKANRIMPDTSQPGVPQSNGVIEHIHGDIIAGTRALLTEAGIPACLVIRSTMLLSS